VIQEMVSGALQVLGSLPSAKPAPGRKKRARSGKVK
jgi:hypothetical protein